MYYGEDGGKKEQEEGRERSTWTHHFEVFKDRSRYFLPLSSLLLLKPMYYRENGGKKSKRTAGTEVLGHTISRYSRTRVASFSLFSVFTEIHVLLGKCREEQQEEGRDRNTCTVTHDTQRRKTPLLIQLTDDKSRWLRSSVSIRDKTP